MSDLTTHLDVLQIFSPFAYAYVQKTGEPFFVFLEQFPLSNRLGKDGVLALIDEWTKDINDEQQAMSALRTLRQTLMARWIWQDALGVIELTELTAELSAFADGVICFAKEFVYHKLTHRYGEPFFKQGKTIKKDEFAIIAMGKLGAGELNLSSDIDLIFIHRASGETDGKKCVDSQKFMTALGQGVIKMIDSVTQDGFVFRVDMRLRPWGDGSPLVMTTSALHKYFFHHGRTWERFAWLKARVVNEISPEFLGEIYDLRQSFVFRYYVDYSAFSALREMRMLITNQVAQREDLDNVKLGMGGIRDIEFVAQSFALIYGGSYPVLMQKTACLDALDELGRLHLLDLDVVENLKNAYRFLRRLEHAIQARHDEQTQRLPKGDELTALAYGLGFDGTDSLIKALNAHRERVSEPFDKLVLKREYVNKTAPSIDHERDLASLAGRLDDGSLVGLANFWQSHLVKSLSDEAKNRLDKAYPVMIHALLAYGDTCPDGAIEPALVGRLIALLEAIAKRSIYLVMLSENPKATMDLIPILAKSPWIADELKSYPVLLDTFLQKRHRHLPDKTELNAILAQSLLSVVPFDDEAFLMAIRLFKKTQVLAVATSDVLRQYPIMKVSDSLTFISEVVLSACLNRAFFELTSKHGFPLDGDGKRLTMADMGFAIVGYGKLGGIEMGYASDLDLVFLHRVDEQGQTDGDKPISGMKFATRLVQKIINYLSTQTRDGRAYELDMRLRPSGNAGVMVNSLAGFAFYQQQKAWVWEHQALVRARGICGDKAVLDGFDKIRLDVLTTQRDSTKLKEEVIAMRQKMYAELSLKDGEFHLKKSRGGMIDIEFMAQFCVLNYAHAHPDLAIWSDNVRIFEMAQKVGVWTQDVCQTLNDAYLSLRLESHKKALAQSRAIALADDWQDIGGQVTGIWQGVFEKCD